jgi:hypothetical protein
MKVGSAFASRFFVNHPFHRFGRRSFLRMSAASAVVSTAENHSVSGGPLTGRESPL